jgi:hypothetical protein
MLGMVCIDVGGVISHLQTEMFFKCMPQFTQEIDLIAVCCAARLSYMSISSLNTYVYTVKRRLMYVEYAINAFQILLHLGYITEFIQKEEHFCVRKVLFRAVRIFCKYPHKCVKCVTGCLPVPKVLKFTTGFIYEKRTLSGRAMFSTIEQFVHNCQI